ncbi:TPA: hypothetical protein N0F65_000489 [Lagenidium giganteum]|uniref:Mannosyltransferase n=1 Tax=Lagenidium giganteum TaxID=4803 RepID=A0AAV2YWC8_9STRA|nr:TPA: hypothetical protein N0F65_000489 [Lagenidium giganteum]
MGATKRAPARKGAADATAVSGVHASMQQPHRKPLAVPAGNDERLLWTPTFETAVSMLLLPRVISALVNPIADCDETFNYWEPLHYMLYRFGFQTWEYSPVYALRSYFYLAVHAVATKVAALGFVLGAVGGNGTAAGTSKVLLFYGLRGALALACAYCEALFYRSCITQFGRRTGRYLLWTLIWSAGIFHASTAFLPSTFVMYMMMLLLSAWMDRAHFVAITWGVIAVLCGWPYVGVCFVPFAIDTLATRGLIKSLVAGAVIGGCVLGAELVANYHYYRRWVLPAWNIVEYNVLSNETDSTLYGTEPWTFYVFNLVLNFNVLAFLVPLAALFALLLPSIEGVSKTRLLAFLSPLYIWMAIMFSQAHKEERFLFPVYPLLCLGAAVTLSAIAFQTQRVFGPASAVGGAVTKLIVWGTLGSYAVLSASRVTSNTLNYSAPLRVYQHLSEHVLPNQLTARGALLGPNAAATVCISKEWYRFPTSFFIPSNATQVLFLKSSFSGLLPKPFEQHENGTSTIPSAMNNQNREEPSRYANVEDCDYVVDLNLPAQTETKYWEHPATWEMIHFEWFLHTEASRSPYRAFYIPFLTPKHVQYTKYAVYMRKPQ